MKHQTDNTSIYAIDYKLIYVLKHLYYLRKYNFNQLYLWTINSSIIIIENISGFQSTYSMPNTLLSRHCHVSTFDLFGKNGLVL